MTFIPTNSEHVNAVPHGQPIGRFTVQVCDGESGKVKRTYESDNYVAPMHYSQAKHLQTQLVQNGVFPTTPGTNPIDEAVDAQQGYAAEGTPTPGITPSMVVCTDWDTAEDTTEDWGKGNITAFAPFIKVTALSTGRKGLINETESSMAANGSTVTYVWDWSTTQGNGTFQSIMLSNVGVYSDTNAALYCGAGEHGRYFPWSGGASGDIINRVEYCSDDTTIYAVGAGDDDGLNYLRWIDCTTDFGGGGGSTADASGRWYLMGGMSGTDWPSWTQAATNWMTTSSSGSTSTYFAGPGWDCCHDGTNIYFVRHGNSGTLGVHAYNLGTGTALYDNTATGWTPVTNGTSWTRHCMGVTIVSTKLYAIYMDSNTATDFSDRQRIARLDATTGAFEAWVDLSSVLEATEYLTGNIESDGTDLIVETTQGIKKFTVGGAYVANSAIGAPRFIYPWVTGQLDGQATNNLAHWQEQGVAPDSTGVYWQLGPYRTGSNGVHSSRQGPFVHSDFKFVNVAISYRYWEANQRNWLVAPFARVSSTNMSSSWTSKQQKLFRHDGKLWLGDRIASTHTVQNTWGTATSGFACYSVDGFNMFSRARLDSPVTKSSSETMKITYQIVLPADPLNEITHRDPWA